MDSSLTPDVLTRVKVEDCLIEIYAYRELSFEECQIQIRKYLIDHNMAALPKRGTVKIYVFME